MPDSRNALGWLLLGLLGAVTAGGAILGVSQSPGTASLSQAVTNTLNAPSYREVFTETVVEGSETGYFTYQAPDRLGGYVENAGRKTYRYIQGSTEYSSVTVSKGSSTAHLVFYRQHTLSPIQDLDPVLFYLGLEQKGRVLSRSGNTYSVLVHNGGQTGTIDYTVSGQYIGRFTIEAQQTSVVVTVSDVGNAPAPGLPPGARIIGLPSGALG